MAPGQAMMANHIKQVDSKENNPFTNKRTCVPQEMPEHPQALNVTEYKHNVSGKRLSILSG
eukprot:2135038-Amphidinium_carterae.1